MQHTTRQAFPARLLAGAATLLLAACSGGGSIDIGGSQGADPATVDYPIAYVKRAVPQQGDDLRELRDATPGASLWVRDRASPSAPERNVTERVTGEEGAWDIKDVDVSTDGTRFIFAMRGPLAMNQDEKEQPTWDIWEYDVPGDALRRVIASDTIAAEGQDVFPTYLPDGRIVFSSTRQRQSQAVLRDEGKPGFEAQTDTRNESAFVLHVMNADGTDIHQLSFNQSHDLSPTVLADGRLLWSRWDGATGRGIHLYTANPDGTGLQLHYGAYSHATGTPGGPPVQFVRARETQDGRILSLLRPYTGSDFGGDLTLIDTSNYVENAQPLAASAGMPGPAQSKATPNDVRTVPGPSPDGRFLSAFPLWDGTQRILVSWSQCRLFDHDGPDPTRIVPCTAQRLAAANPQPAPPLYSAFIFDPADNTFKPLFEPVEGVMITDLVAAQPRAPQRVILDRIPGVDFDVDLQADGVGILDIRSVYDFDGTVRNTGPGTPDIATLANPALVTAAQRPARFLRIEKAVSIGDRDLGFPRLDGAAFGSVGYMREILGYAPIEPDGSVQVRVPANVAFVISILDQDGRRLFPPHRNWLQLLPGETRSCNGCHQATTPATAHGRDGLSQPAWQGATAGVPFPGTLARLLPGAGQTMAQARAQWSCVNEGCASQQLSPNLVYTDEWTDPLVAGRDPDEPLSLPYTGATGLATPAPATPGCLSSWDSTCRIVINYLQHIHPLWSLDRREFDVDDTTVLADHTCTGCHGPSDAALAAQVPAGQLDLTDTDSNQQPLHKHAYRQLLFSHDELELAGGTLQPRVVTSIDPQTGEPVQTTPQVPPPLAAANARGSGRFFNLFAPGGSHAGWLSDAELRLLSEWVDIGAQYFNNPFDPAAPLN